MANSGWIKYPTNDERVGFVQETGIALGNAGTTNGFSSNIAPYFVSNFKVEKRWGTLSVKISTTPASGTCSVRLWGNTTDTAVGAIDISGELGSIATGGATTVGFQLDMNKYAYPFLFVGFTNTGDDHLKTAIVTLAIGSDN